MHNQHPFKLPCPGEDHMLLHIRNQEVCGDVEAIFHITTDSKSYYATPDLDTLKEIRDRLTEVIRIAEAPPSGWHRTKLDRFPTRNTLLTKSLADVYTVESHPDGTRMLLTDGTSLVTLTGEALRKVN